MIRCSGTAQKEASALDTDYHGDLELIPSHVSISWGEKTSPVTKDWDMFSLAFIAPNLSNNNGPF